MQVHSFFIVGSVANLVFDVKDLSRLFMMQENRVSAVDLNVYANELGNAEEPSAAYLISIF